MSKGALRVTTPDEVSAQERAQAVLDAEATAAINIAEENIAAHVRKEFQRYRMHRTRQNLDNRFLEGIRAYNGEYPPEKLAEIRGFGGSEVFARVTMSKCRGASALLRDIYLGGERPWKMAATPVPEVPQDIVADIEKLLEVEQKTSAIAGQPVDEMSVMERANALHKAAQRAAKKQADEDARQAATRIEDILVEGGFYNALKEFITDLPIFPFACIKGPEVKNTVEVRWTDGKMSQRTVPKMFWRRVSPFDLYFSPEASYVQDAQVIERIRLRRADITQLLGLPGYNEENLRAVLSEYANGYVDAVDGVESERADVENRENPYLNQGDMYDTLEFHGYVRGEWLIDFGFPEEEIPDPIMEYSVIAWVIGRYTIKVAINPNPKQGHPYYATSLEKIPGSIYGSSLPEIIRDIQDVANASLRSLVNNLAISSGPQVVVNEDRLHISTNPDTLYPWKRWRVTADPYGNTTSEKPIDFFQPQSNAQELLGVYRAMMEMADEISAIPRYVSGGMKTGGAASTASGLSMLMNNVAKVLQNVAASIDTEVLEPLLTDLYTMLLLTSPEPYFRGDTKVMVRGVAVAMQKETERMRKLEMLQLTMNPVDTNIIGLKGRAALLRDIAGDLGMPGDDIIPDDDTLDAMQKAQQQQQLQQQAAQGQGAQGEMPRNDTRGRVNEEFDNRSRTNVR